jgi:CIC family chloride channel protein
VARIPTGREGLGGGTPPLFFRSLRDFLRVIPNAAQRFWVLVIATGVLSGAGAGALLAGLRLVQRVAWPEGDTFVGAVEASTPLRRVAVPVLAGVAVSLLAIVSRLPLAGHGTARIIEAIWHRGRELVLGRTLARGVVSIGAVGMGASLGREGALVSTGAAAGSWLATRLGIDERQARVIVACGAASGIAAAYDVPIGGALFGLEVLLGSFALELLGPIVVSCVVATAVSRTLPGAHVEYVIPEYELLRPSELLLGLALAPLFGLASAVYVRVMGWMEVQLDRLPRWAQPLLPPLAMALVGLVAIRWPPVLGNGFDTIQQMLLGNLPLAALAVLPWLKLAATALCAGSGVPGGLFTPSLFYGALLGGAFGQLINIFWPGGAPSGAYALLGMGAVLAGTTHAPVSAVLIIFELTGDYGLILPLMLGAFLSTVISRRLEPESLYTSVLNRRNVRIPATVPDWLRQEGPRALLTPIPNRVSPSTSFQEIVVLLLEQPSGMDLYVTDEEGRYLGTIALDELKGHLPDHSLLGATIAADVMDRHIQPITPDLSLAEVASRFSQTPLERLPVVDLDRRLLGTISKSDVLKQGRF